MMRYLTVILLFLSIASVCHGQDITISADTDRQEVSLNEQVTLTITVSGNVSNIPQPDIPNLKGFTTYSAGRSQNVSIINGQVSSSVSFTYILVPNAIGDYSLGPFSINYKGNTYSAGPIDIKVLDANTGQQKAPFVVPPGQSADSEDQENQQSLQHGKEIFVETYVDKLRAYVNEQITLTFAVYQAVDLFDNPVYNPPSTTGFWAEDMPPQKKYYKVVNGARYLVTEIKTALFAIAPGEFTIGPARLEATVEDMDRFFSKNPFDAFDRDPFSMFKRGKPIALQTEPIKVEILPLPEKNKPANFKGDVGDFDVSLYADKGAVEENQPVSLKIKIKGKGNIKTINSPVIPDMGDVKFYESGSSENISKDNYIVQGEKVFDKMVIPKKQGMLAIGPVEYSYFNPALNDYVNKRLSPLTVEVTKSKEEPAEKSAFVPSAEKEDVQLLKKDISYIKIFSPRFEPRDNILYKNKVFLLINILPLIALAGLYLYELYRNKIRTDIGYARSLRARGAASKRLRAAKNLINKNMVKEFYTEIYKAVIEYIADKLNIPHASITKDSLEESLKRSGVADDITGKVKTVFDDCDMARFASARFGKTDMINTIKDAENIITGLERYI